MSHPLIDRLTNEMGWPRIGTEADLAAFTEADGEHAVFVPGDASRNLETADVAVILPELAMAFQGRFDCAVASPEMEDSVKTRAGVHKTPNIVFFRAGEALGSIPKVRDWDDYVTRIPQILSKPVAAE